MNISYRAALDDPWDICKAKNFDKKADQICTLIINGKKIRQKKKSKQKSIKRLERKEQKNGFKKVNL